jgi:hypothetical protein
MDARSIGACIRMTYTGKSFDSSGQIAMIPSFPASELWGGPNTLTPQAPPSVNDLFRFSNDVTRLGLDTRELVWRCDTENAEIFHNVSDGYRIVSGQVPSLGGTGNVLNSRGFGFAWRGLDVSGPTPANLSLGFTKSVEWRANPQSGLTSAHQESRGRSMVPIATAVLDKAVPNWNSKILGQATSLGSQISNAAVSGVAQAIGGASTGFFRTLAAPATRAIASEARNVTSFASLLSDMAPGLLALM